MSSRSPSIAEGTQVYDVSDNSVRAEGWEIALSDATNALSGGVAERVYDDEGTDDLREALNGLALTAFETKALDDLLSSDAAVEPWRIGESLAECYLADHQDCRFPWHTGRDQRNPKSSDAGADLVGFRGQDDDTRFAFGEVKTSDDGDAPPGVMYGRHGMIHQIDGLANDPSKARALIKYLAHRYRGATWETDFKTACKAYLKNQKDIILVGVLVRTTQPDEADLRARSKALSQRTRCPVILLALYIPVSLSDWSSLCASGRTQ